MLVVSFRAEIRLVAVMNIKKKMTLVYLHLCFVQQEDKLLSSSCDNGVIMMRFKWLCYKCKSDNNKIKISIILLKYNTDI